MKKIIKGVLKFLGIVAFKRSTGIYIPDEDSYRIAVEQCRKKSPVILDGGAHRGDSVRSFSKYLENSTFHCFEPDPLLADELKSTFRENHNVKVVTAALGEKRDQVTFNLNFSKPTNSILQTASSLPEEIQELCKTIEQIQVDVITVDEYCADNGINQIDILKLDLQGYDYKALLGAEKTLRNVQVVLTEVLFTEIYKGCGLFSQVLNLMIENGFSLYTICGIHYGKKDELLWADAIFVRSK
jgi:FkbM family methyltransferase